MFVQLEVDTVAAAAQCGVDGLLIWHWGAAESGFPGPSVLRRTVNDPQENEPSCKRAANLAPHPSWSQGGGDSC